MPDSTLRQALLSAAGHRTGLSAGFDLDRVVVPPLAQRNRLLLVHRLTTALLAGREERVADLLQEAEPFDVQLAVLRGTALTMALARETTTPIIVIPGEPTGTALNALRLMSSDAADPRAGYHQFACGLASAARGARTPAIDLVEGLLGTLDPIHAQGAALAASVAYQSQLRASGDSPAVLHDEQLALMTAFVGADAISYRDGHLLIP